MKLCSSDPPLLHASSLTDDNQVIYAQYLHEGFSNVLSFQTYFLGAVTSCKLFGIPIKHIGRDTHAIFRIRLAKYPWQKSIALNGS